MRRLLTGLFVALGLAGCAGATAPVVVGGHPIEIVGKRKDLPFDQSAARLEAALKQLHALVGHPVRMQIDAALLDEWRTAVEDNVADSIENVARDLERLRTKQPAVFAFAAPRLQRVYCHHDPLAERKIKASFDVAAGVVHVVTHGGSRELVPEGVVRELAEEEFAKYVDTTFRTKRPDEIQASERAAYFEWLTDYRTAERRGKRESLATDPRAATITNVVRLHELVEPSALRTEIRTWLIRDGSRFFRDAYWHEGDAVRTAPAGSAFKLAEAAYVHFLVAVLPTLDDDARLEVARVVWTQGRERSVDAFPGFDRFAFGLAVVDEWIKAGHPNVWNSNAPKVVLFDFVVCPHPKDKSGSRSLGTHCDKSWYTDALETPEAKKRLVDALTARADRELVESAFVTFRMMSSRTTFDMLRAVEAHAPTWKMASEVLLEEFIGVADKGTVLEEAVRVWRERPERRGFAIAFVAESDRYDNGAVKWKDLPQRLGSTIEQADFAAFLDSNRLALSRAAVVWPALSPGWSRVDVLAPRLERWLDERLVREDHSLNPGSAVMAVVHRLCEEGARPDLAKLGSLLDARQKRHPGESWTTAIDECKRCGTAPAPRRSAPRPIVPTRPSRGGPIGPPPPTKPPAPLAL